MSRALILMYHAVDEPRGAKEARFCVKPGEFSAQMRWLSTSGYLPVSLDVIVDSLEARQPIPANAVAITFDDGFADFCDHALPVLQRYRIPSTMFPVTMMLSGTNEWMQGRGFPTRSIMSVAQLREIHAAGVTIGSHSLTHARMTEIGPERLARETKDSKHQLEDLLGQQLRYFAYPYGLLNEDVKHAVHAAGYGAACSTRPGFNRDGEDLFALRRIDVYGGDTLWRFRQKLKFGANDVSALYPLRYYAQRVAGRIGL